MRQLKYMLMLCVLALLALSSCKKETEGISDVVYYPELKGANPYTTSVGGYVEAVVDANGSDITSQCEISPNLVTATEPGAYTVVYKYKNSFGIELELTRKVCLRSASDQVSGYYAYKSYKRAPQDFAAAWKENFAVGHLLIMKDETAGSDTYLLQDVLLGHYHIGRGADSRYQAPALIKLNSDNSVTLESIVAPIAPWGDAETDYVWEGGSYDPATKTFTLSSSYPAIGQTITVELTLKD